MLSEIAEPFPAVQTRPLFTMRLAVDGLRLVGGPAGAVRRIGDISGGQFKGERLKGFVLAGGSDWQVLRGDDVVALDGRIVLQCDDGAVVAMTYCGLRHGPADVMARLGKGEEVDPTSYYFRIVPSFSTSDRRYDWLNRVVAIGIGRRHPDGPVYFVHEVV